MSLHTAASRLARKARQVMDDVAGFFRKDLPAHLEKIGLRDAAGDELHHQFAVRTTDWVIVACLIYRVVATPFVLIGGLSTIGPTADRYAPVIVGLMLWNVFLAAGVLRPRIRALLGTRTFAVIDTTLAATVNLWGAAILPRGVLLHPYQDVFWIYAMGTVGLWTALKGARRGLSLVAAGGVVPLGMAELNGATIAGSAVGMILARFGWLLS